MLLVVCAASMAFAVPARPLYEPPQLPKIAPPPLLGGTTWTGTLFIPNSRVTFNPDGTLHYGENGSGSPGTWKLEGNNLSFQINQYSEYKTMIVNGNAIEGIGWNKAGEKCSVKLSMSADPTVPQIPLPPVMNRPKIRPLADR